MFPSKGKSVDWTLASHCAPSQASHIIDIIVSRIRTKDISAFVASSTWMMKLAHVAACATFSRASHGQRFPSGFQLKLLNFIVDCSRVAGSTWYHTQYSALSQTGRLAFLAAVMGISSSIQRQPPSTVEETISSIEALTLFSEVSCILQNFAGSLDGQCVSSDNYLKVAVHQISERIAEATSPEYWQNLSELPRALYASNSQA
jgi:hypothetical protein